MKVAIVGSRDSQLTNEQIKNVLPNEVSEIVSGGAKGVDRCAEEYANTNNIPIKIFKPDYSRFKRGAPLKRNTEIVLYSDLIIIFWNGKSKGTQFVLKECIKYSKKYILVEL
ncbi:MAG: DUF2493 domain-containing protein [Clostridia bacterium]|nr:DUF2493 domain-containing protein [Clostridia bacterium]